MIIPSSAAARQWQTETLSPSAPPVSPAAAPHLARIVSDLDTHPLLLLLSQSAGHYDRNNIQTCGPRSGRTRREALYLKREAITRTILDTVVDRAIRDIAEDSQRSLRKLVDMGQTFAKGPFQKRYIGMIQ